MSKISDLINKVKKVPEAKRYLKTAQNFNSIKTKIDETQTKIKKITDQISSLRIFDDENLALDPNQTLKKIKLNLETLKTKTNDDNFGQNIEDEIFTVLDESADNLNQKIEGCYQKFFHQKKQSFLSLITLAEQAKFEQAPDMQHKLQSLDQFMKPPESSANAKTLKSALQSLETQIDGLGLSPNIKTFIKKAIDGRATLRDLEDKEVAKYLDDKDLKRKLRVKL